MSEQYDETTSTVESGPVEPEPTPDGAETAVEPTDIPTLRQDPTTGAYRPG